MIWDTGQGHCAHTIKGVYGVEGGEGGGFQAMDRAN